MTLLRDPIAFPKLDHAQIAVLERFAQLRQFQPGEALFSAGERNIKFFIVKSGEVVLVDSSSG